MSGPSPRRRRAASNGAPAPSRVYVVDRVEGATAVLAPDAEVSDADVSDVDIPGVDVRAAVPEDVPTLDVATSALPARCAVEGAVLRVPLDAAGAPRWAAAVRDRAEEDRRRADARTRLDRLRASDAGGDVTL